MLDAKEGRAEEASEAEREGEGCGSLPVEGGGDVGHGGRAESRGSSVVGASRERERWSGGTTSDKSDVLASDNASSSSWRAGRSISGFTTSSSCLTSLSCLLCRVRDFTYLVDRGTEVVEGADDLNRSRRLMMRRSRRRRRRRRRRRGMRGRRRGRWFSLSSALTLLSCV